LSIISLTLNLAKILAQSDHKQLKNVYVSTRSVGILPNLIDQSLVKFNDGKTLTQTSDFLATATRATQVRRLTNSIQIAIYRGTPILDVFNNQIFALNKQINFNLMKLLVAAK
jgi:hypothetical protein